MPDGYRYDLADPAPAVGGVRLALGVEAVSTPVFLGFTMARHILGRAVLTATAETSA